MAKERGENCNRPWTSWPACPYEVIVWAVISVGGSGILAPLRLLRLLRVGKLYRIFSGIEILPRGLKVISILAGCGILIHWIACLWINIAPSGQALDFATRYNMALYWTVTTLTTVGYGDIAPNSNMGRILAILIMFLGVGVYGLVISSIAKITFSTFRHKERMQEKLQDLSSLMAHYGVPRKVQKEVFSYYGHLFRQRLSDNDQRILRELPHNLKQEMEIYMVFNLIGNIPLFEGLSCSELKVIAKCLGQEFYSPRDFIIYKGEWGDKMFIISNGGVNILNEREEVLGQLKPGQFFGEIALMADVRRTTHVQANAYCDLYTLSKADFFQLIARYPRLKKNRQRLMAEHDPVETAA